MSRFGSHWIAWLIEMAKAGYIHIRVPLVDKSNRPVLTDIFLWISNLYYHWDTAIREGYFAGHLLSMRLDRFFKELISIKTINPNIERCHQKIIRCTFPNFLVGQRLKTWKNFSMNSERSRKSTWREATHLSYNSLLSKLPNFENNQEFEDPKDAEEAVEKMNRKDYEGRELVVEIAGKRSRSRERRRPKSDDICNKCGETGHW